MVIVIEISHRLKRAIVQLKTLNGTSVNPASRAVKIKESDIVLGTLKSST